MDSSVSPRVEKQKQYDVFLSFRGEDTRKGFVSHLHNALLYKKLVHETLIDTFKDDAALVHGDSISTEIKEAIHNSKFAIVVISENFVSSTWCLNELLMIMDLHKKQKLVALPIFYDVDPSDVKHQRGTLSLQRYECARFKLLFSSEKRKMAARVRKWRDALTQIGGTSGKHSSKCKDEATMVEDVVEHIARELSAMEPIELVDLVGMDSHMEKIAPLLDMDSTTDEVRFIGIWGMGGIGKTAIAKYLYRKYLPRFGKRYCFVESIRISATNGIPHLQRAILSEIMGKKQAKISSEGHGCTFIKSKLKKLKVLLVLDDVDNEDQLRALAKETSWFGPGSRIIVTTRDVRLLSLHGIRFVHHVNFLGHDDSIRVFKQNAFQGGKALDDVCEQLSIRASKLAQGLPSALEAFGKHLHDTPIKEWGKKLDNLEKKPHERIKGIVRTSYEGLDEQDQAVFLQLACLFNGDALQRVTSLIDNGETRIKGIEEKSLIDISHDGCITMHVLVEQVARDIVSLESKSKSWRQRILWEPDQIIYVMKNNKGKATVEGMALDMCMMGRKEFIEGGILYAINNLKFFTAFISLNDKESMLQFFPDTDKLPETLRLLHWDAYPITTLPSEYYPNCLVELNLRYSNLVRLWDGAVGLNQLRRLDVTGSKNLTEIPDLSKAMLLEELIMKGCTRLKRTSESIGRLSFLRKLDLSNCDGLMNLQMQISEKTVLSECGLSRRRQIILRLPKVAKKLSSLTNLAIEGKIHIELSHLRGNAEHLSFLSEQEIPDELIMVPKEQSPLVVSSGFYALKSLSIKRFSYIKDGAHFVCITFSGFPCLTQLNLINLNIQKIPEDIGLLHSLEKLDLSGNHFKYLPASMKNILLLKHVILSNCIKLETLPQLTHDIQTLNLHGCSNLRSLQELSPDDKVQDMRRYNLLELELNNCKNIQALSEQLSRHFTNLIQLDLSRHDFEAIPKSIRELSSLGTLYLNNCKKLRSVEELPLSLNHLYAHGCVSLENVTLSSDHSIIHIDLSHCFNLQKKEHLMSQFLNNGFSGEVSQRLLCLPGTGLPRYFDNRSNGTCTKIKLPPIRLTTRTLVSFAACILISCEMSSDLRFPAFSYDWNYEDDDEVIWINLRPDLSLPSKFEEEETYASHHMVILHVASSIDTENFEELRLKSHLQLPDEYHQSTPGEIIACGVHIISHD